MFGSKGAEVRYRMRIRVEENLIASNPNPEGDQQCKGSSCVYVVNME